MIIHNIEIVLVYNKTNFIIVLCAIKHATIEAAIEQIFMAKTFLHKLSQLQLKEMLGLIF